MVEPDIAQPAHVPAPNPWAGQAARAAASGARPRPLGARHLRSVTPGSLAASVVANGLDNVDLGIQRLSPRRGGARRGRLVVIAALGLALFGAVALRGQYASFASEPAALARPAAPSAPALAPVDLEALRTSAAAARESSSVEAAVETVPGPGGLAVSIRPVESNYTVVQGDTLERIAQRFGTSVDALVGMNNLRDRNSLQLGQKLIIP